MAQDVKDAVKPAPTQNASTIDDLVRLKNASVERTISPKSGDIEVKVGREGAEVTETIPQSKVDSILKEQGFSGGNPSTSAYWSTVRDVLDQEISRRQATSESFGTLPSSVKPQNQVGEERSRVQADAARTLQEQAAREDAIKQANQNILKAPSSMKAGFKTFFRPPPTSTIDKTGKQGGSTGPQPSKSVEEAKKRLIEMGLRRKKEGITSVRDVRRNPLLGAALLRDSVKDYLARMFGSGPSAKSGEEAESDEREPLRTTTAIERAATSRFSLAPTPPNAVKESISQKIFGTSRDFAAKKIESKVEDKIKNKAASMLANVALGIGTGGLATVAKVALAKVLGSGTVAGLVNKAKDLGTKALIAGLGAWTWLLLNSPFAGIGAAIGGTVGLIFGGPVGAVAGFTGGAVLGYTIGEALGANGGISVATAGGGTVTGGTTVATATSFAVSPTVVLAGGAAAIGIPLFFISTFGAVALAFLAPPAEHEHGREAVFSVSKVANPSALPNYDPNSTTPTTITYKLIITAGANPLEVTSITDKITCQNKDGACKDKDGKDLVQEPKVAMPPGPITPGSPYETTYQITIVGPAYKDTYLVNAATVVATDTVTHKEETQVASVAIPINNPPTQQPYNFPVSGGITSFDLAFGYPPISGKTHNSYFRMGVVDPNRRWIDGGIDIGGSGQVKSTSAGTVLMAKWFGPELGCNGTGGTVYVQSGFYVVEYLHLDRSVESLDPTSPANRGKTVTVARGQVIGNVYPAGLNSCTSTGPHVHYQIAYTSGGNVPFSLDSNAGFCNEGKIYRIAHKQGGESITPQEVATPICAGDPAL